VSDEERPDDSEPTPERQAELLAAHESNVKMGKPPYDGVTIRTQGELSWVMRERGSTGEANSLDGRVPANLSGAFPNQANLSGAFLVRANLSGAYLSHANLSGAVLNQANLSGAGLMEADLSGAVLEAADLSGAVLWRANLERADLFHATLSGADLSGATLSGADLSRANLSDANLRTTRMNASTNLTDARLDARTLLADIFWNGVPMTRLNWDEVATLGDELVAKERTLRPDDWRGPGNKDKATRLRDFQDAVMTYRQVATLLRSQGLNEPADRFTSRAQVLQQQVLWRQRRFGAYLFSRLLDALTGYGYRLERILFAYVAVVCGFAALSLAGVALSGHTVGEQEAQTALVASLQTFHGHDFGNIFAPRGAVAFIEALCGLVIESTFIAMLVQRLRAGSG